MKVGLLLTLVGVCEYIFSNFLEYINKATSFETCCSQCGGDWGCALCLFRHHCEQNNEALFTPIGASILGLELEKKANETADLPTPPSIPTLHPSISATPPTRPPLAAIDLTNRPTAQAVSYVHRKQSLQG
jgi:hypothetical protein